MIVFNGDYLHGRIGYVTVVDFEENSDKCKVLLLLEAALPFTPEWKPFSRQGYQKYAKIPDDIAVDMTPAKLMRNERFPENNSIHFYELTV